MPAYTAKRFGGSTPRLAAHLLGADNAGEARDCKLWHGKLESWRQPRAVLPAPVEGDVLTAYLFECCWLTFETCVDVAVGPVNCRKLFTTGDQPWPAVMEFLDAEAPCEPTVRRLGVPCADAAPSVVYGVLTGTAERDTEGRSYAYQYENAAGERGSLSQPSPFEQARDGQPAIVSGWEIPDASWGITSVRIYRTVSGYQPPGKETGNVLDTVWMLVGSAPIGAVSFNDTGYNELLIEALEEDIADPPPPDLRGITHINSINALAGFIGKRLYFSENNSYHQWPYYLDLDDNIRGIVESNGLLYVGTDGAPYVIVAATDCKNAGCRESVRLPGVFPMVGFGSRKIAATTTGAVYSTHDGLVALSGRNPPALLTHPLYAPDDWHRLGPETLVPIAHAGKLFVFGQRNGSLVLTMPGGAESGWPLDLHSTLSDNDVRDAVVSRQGDLYLLRTDGSVVQWDRGALLRPHRWRSPEVVTDLPVNFGAAHLQNLNGSESVTIENDKGQSFQRDVPSPRVFRLPGWMLGTRWRVTLEGVSSVSLFSMATSMKELGA